MSDLINALFSTEISNLLLKSYQICSCLWLQMLINESRWLNYIFRDLRISDCCSVILGRYTASTGQ